MCMIKKQMIITENSPFAILGNRVLPIRCGKDVFPTVEHYRMASMIIDPVDRANILSYGDVERARLVFNRVDEEQYIRLIRKACDTFYKKVIRGSKEARGVLRSQGERMRFDIDREDLPMKTILGVMNMGKTHAGYNCVGGSLEKIRHSLVSSGFDDDVLWRCVETDIPSRLGREYHFRRPRQGGAQQKEDVIDHNEEVVIHETDDDEFEDEEKEEEEEEDRRVLPAPTARDVPTGYSRKTPWRFVPVGGAYLDEERWAGIENERLEGREVRMRDPLATPTRDVGTDAMRVFKIYKATEYLVRSIQQGVDIERYADKEIETILWEGKICVEIFFGNILTQRQRHDIYIDTWDRFKAGTLPYQAIIMSEIMYPKNLVGFVRKTYIRELNAAIGVKIRDVLFHEFLGRVIESDYPDSQREFRDMMVLREAKNFSVKEYEEISDRLYHYVFAGRFLISQEKMAMIHFYESQRKTVEEIEEAVHFLPRHHNTSDETFPDVFHPLRVWNISIDGKHMTDLVQYIYYSLYIFYGDMTPHDAYALLHQDGAALPGNHPLLQDRLVHVIDTRRYLILKQALSIKINTYPRIREMLLFLRSVGDTDIRFQGVLDVDTGRIWREFMDDLSHEDQILMDMTTSLVKKDAERSMRLYFIIKDFFRSARLFQQLCGKKIQDRELDVFLKCFGGYMTVLTHDNEKKLQPSPIFHEYIQKTKIFAEREWMRVWDSIQGCVRQFQKKTFHPALSADEIKKDGATEHAITTALLNVLTCLYTKDAEIPQDDLHILVEIISGKDNIPSWINTTFEIVMEDMPKTYGENLPAVIRERLHAREKRKRKKAKERVVQYALIDPSISRETQNTLTTHFSNAKNIARISYAISAIREHTSNTRRINIYL